MHALKLLAVEDDPNILLLYRKTFSRLGYVVHEATTLAEARIKILQERYDVLLLDLILPDGNGMDLIAVARESHPSLAIVVITGSGDVAFAVDAMRKGADNFLVKPVKPIDVDLYLKKSFEERSLKINAIISSRTKTNEVYFGQSAESKKTEEHVMRAAQSEAPAVLMGETGTGKGVAARWIHDHSSRANMPFVELNCSMLRDDLLAGELFGHVKGAFTSAVSDRQGLVELADGGTLFLDEIADMDIEVQTQLLKVIEEKQFRRLGDSTPRRSEFRLICATNIDLRQAVEQKRFRKDLYYRILVLPIIIPPLRDRIDDLPGLAAHLLKLMGKETSPLSSEVIQYLQSYSWPGNIRELRNVLERVVSFSGKKLFETHDFAWIKSSEAAAPACPPVNRTMNLELLEKHQIMRAIDQCNGNIEEASALLGVSKTTVYRKLKKYSLDTQDRRSPNGP